MRSVCVFLGSSSGVDPEFTRQAARLGQALAESGRTLVYGGARVGLMGALADAALAAGGRVIGVIPQALLEREVAHGGLTELRVVATMHERKATMAELSDAFITLPGGLGTLEELFEVWTWRQLGLHTKPIGLLTAAGFFAPLLDFLDQLVAQGFVRPEQRAGLITHADPVMLLEALASSAVLHTQQGFDRSLT